MDRVSIKLPGIRNRSESKSIHRIIKYIDEYSAEKDKIVNGNGAKTKLQRSQHSSVKHLVSTINIELPGKTYCEHTKSVLKVQEIIKAMAFSPPKRGLQLLAETKLSSKVHQIRSLISRIIEKPSRHSLLNPESKGKSQDPQRRSRSHLDQSHQHNLINNISRIHNKQGHRIYSIPSSILQRVCGKNSPRRINRRRPKVQLTAVMSRAAQQPSRLSQINGMVQHEEIKPWEADSNSYYFS